MIKPTKETRGRKSSMRKINMQHLEKLAKDGWTDAEMSDFFGMSKRTFIRLRQRDPNFGKLVNDWKEVADNKVERKLYEKAMGYTHPEEKIFCQDGKVTRVQTIKEYAPDTMSMIFWLTNRKHSDWKRTRETEGTDPLTIKVLNLIKQSGGNGKVKKGQKAITVDSSVQVERGGMQIVE